MDGNGRAGQRAGGRDNPWRTYPQRRSIAAAARTRGSRHRSFVNLAAVDLTAVDLAAVGLDWLLKPRGAGRRRLVCLATVGLATVIQEKFRKTHGIKDMWPLRAFKAARRQFR